MSSHRPTVILLESLSTAQFNCPLHNETELIWFGSRANLSRLSGHDLSIRIGSETIKSVNSLSDLGFRLDNELSMKQHISLIVRTCFYHLRRLRQIRRRAGYEVTVRLVLALIMSTVDFCNALFASHTSVDNRAAAACTKCSGTTCSTTWTA